MNNEPGIDEVLVFELPDFNLATELAMSLAKRWACSVYEDLGTAVVSVLLLPDGDGELAQLLRRVEDWVAWRSLGGLRYWLDHRPYILEAGHLDEQFLPVSSSQ